MSYEFLTTNEAARMLGVSRPLVIQWIDSGQLKGFRIPGSTSRRIPREALAAFARQHGIPVAAEPRVRGLLIVDDDADFAKGVALAVQRADAGWETQIAESGFAAGRLISQMRPSVVLLDIRLKDIDGRKICESLRQDPLLAGIRVIATSGFLNESEERKLRQQGFDGFLKKPFQMPALLALLNPAGQGQTRLQERS